MDIDIERDAKERQRGCMGYQVGKDPAWELGGELQEGTVCKEAGETRKESVKCTKRQGNIRMGVREGFNKRGCMGCQAGKDLARKGCGRV